LHARIRAARRASVLAASGLLRPQPTGAILAHIDAALLSEGRPDALAVHRGVGWGTPQPLGPIFWQGHSRTREVRMTISSSLEPEAARTGAREG
jgi:hypothetical protein